ncbi:MAG TPA: FkbM family methyltransferase [Vicinamibacterales bacterium]|jgi:FkbM family methyltransferase|nr:FkbM family methyltransferase [Vicinamibacterales bacterium]
MVTIEQIDPRDSSPLLGRECRFAVRGGRVAAVEYFLQHEGVFYLHALQSEPDGSVRLYLEAPGRYVLHARWRSEEQERGRTESSFNVPGPSGLTPELAKAEGARLWTPTAWDARLLGTHERPVFSELRKIVRRGATVYDIGANVGVFSAWFANRVGADGLVYAIEPNPVCVYFLRANLGSLRVNHVTILPVALSDRSTTVSFSLNYGSSQVGVGADSTSAAKPGHRIGVDADRLDSLIAALGLRQPDVIKLDVEGAEASALAGMSTTLEQARPHLIVELHGTRAAADALRVLANLGYRYSVPPAAARYETAKALLDSLRDECVQVIGYP